MYVKLFYYACQTDSLLHFQYKLTIQNTHTTKSDSLQFWSLNEVIILVWFKQLDFFFLSASVPRLCIMSQRHANVDVMELSKKKKRWEPIVEPVTGLSILVINILVHSSGGRRETRRPDDTLGLAIVMVILKNISPVVDCKMWLMECFMWKVEFPYEPWPSPSEKKYLEENNYISLIEEHLHFNRNVMCIAEGSCLLWPFYF